MKKRLAMGLVSLFSAATLAACSSSGDTNIITMKGDSITVTDFYEEVKESSASQQAMLSIILSKVLEEKYGKDITEKAVEEKYSETSKAYGDYFATALAQAGLTEEAYKKEVRRSLLLEHTVATAAEAEVTDKDYEGLYASYNPEITAQVIVLADEESAKKVLEEVKAEGADFKKIAEEKSTSEKVEYTFDSSSADLPTEVQAAAFALKKDGISEVVSVTSTSSYTTSYYIVKATAVAEKNPDWKTYKDQLKTIYLNNKKNDPTYINKVLGAILTEANVKIKDEAFANVLSTYGMGQAEETTTAADTTTADTTTAAETTTSAE